MAIAMALGAGIGTVIVAIAITRIPFGGRVIRAVVLSLKEMSYVEAARGLGASHLRMMARHILPQCVAPYLILATTHLGVAIIIEASLGFLGVGIPPPTPTWGNMLADSLNAGLVPPWWLVLFPGARDHPDRARLQPAGRRHPRHARPAAARLGVGDAHISAFGNFLYSRSMSIITRLSIAGYRSLRDVRLELDRSPSSPAPMAAGESSLYRALRLLADIAHGRIIQSLAIEGGLPSVRLGRDRKLSRGGEARRPPGAGHGAQGPDQPEARLLVRRLRLRHRSRAAAVGPRFGRDPEIRSRACGPGRLQRANCSPNGTGRRSDLRDENGERRQADTRCKAYDSMLTHCANPEEGAELLLLRERMRAWRFYDHFRTDRDAPARRPQIGTRTPVLANDGADLAAASRRSTRSATSGGWDAVDDAFPGARSRSPAPRLFRGRDAPARPAAAASDSRAFRRHASLPAAGRRAASPRPPHADDPERAGDQPAPGPAARRWPADRRRRRAPRSSSSRTPPVLYRRCPMPAPGRSS